MPTSPDESARPSIITGTARHRVRAPITAIWPYLTEPEPLLATLPLHHIEIGPDRRTGSFVARIGVGRLRISRLGSGTIISIDEPHRVAFELTLNDRSLTSRHTALLTRLGASESILDYAVELQCEHPMPRLRRFLSGVFDLHVRDYAEHITTTAERHWRAERALGVTPPSTRSDPTHRGN